MIDIFRLDTNTPGLLIFENSEGDIILALGPPPSKEMTNGLWRERIQFVCRLISNSILPADYVDQNAYEVWQSLPPAPMGDTLCDYKSVSELTNLSISTLRNYHADHKMPEPYIYRGGSPLWLKDAIVAWLAARGK